MEFFKKNKVVIILGGIFVLIMVATLIAGIHLLYPDGKISKYGNRTDGIENVPIHDDKVESIKSSLMETQKVVEVTYNLEGRLINFIVDVVPETDIVSAKALSDKILLAFNEQEKAYYDMQLYITCKDDAESEIYPIIGYKHKTSMNFVWTN